jgi:cyclic pyranopterin phosphate synthase
LFSSEEIDLLTAFRKGDNIVPLINKSIGAKHFSRAGIDAFSDNNIQTFEQNRNMTSIGG